MTDRESIMFLTRGTEALVQRGRDIRYMQEHQDAEHVRLLQDLLDVLDRMRNALISELREFSPPAERVQQLPTGRERNPVDMSASKKSV
jgi:hypothetical protein